MSVVQEPHGLAILDGKSEPADKTDISLQNLLPIAMVIVGGCESCAEKMVQRALHEGSTFEEIDKTLRIIAGTQKLSCFAIAVGPEIIARMEKPLDAGRRTLREAKNISLKDNGPNA